MNALTAAIIAFVGYFIAYRLYGRFLARKIFRLDDTHIMPSQELKDGIDFVPTKKVILFGHHFSSIAGAGPIVGPAIAVIWGWVPAMLWVVFGSIFIGGVHDLSSLVLSIRHKGKSVGFIAEEVMNPAVRVLFLLIVFFLLLLVVSVFTLIISLLFTMYPASIFPIWTQIPIAMGFGYIINKKNGNVTVWGIISLILLYAIVYYAAVNSYWSGFHIFPILDSELFTWIILLLVYCFFASTIPVHWLLQPRDYINSNMLIVGMASLFLGLVFLRPEITAPAFNTASTGAPNLIPILFITIACGAISGFHSMIASGTTAKQQSKETDSLFIGYGAMLTEGALAVLVILACTAGLGDLQAWTRHYSSWASMEGLSAKIGAFVEGSAAFLAALHIPPDISRTMICVMVIAFSATTLDSSTRIWRYVTTELAETWDIKPLKNRYTATGFGLILALALSVIPPLLRTGKVDGSGGMLLWPLFGTGNQLLAGLALLVVNIWLWKQRKRIIYAFLPFVFVIIITGWAMMINLREFFTGGHYHLFVIGLIIFILELIMIIYGIQITVKMANKIS